jgi:hypothetical protein
MLSRFWVSLAITALLPWPASALPLNFPPQGRPNFGSSGVPSYPSFAPYYPTPQPNDPAPQSIDFGKSKAKPRSSGAEAAFRFNMALPPAESHCIKDYCW